MAYLDGYIIEEIRMLNSRYKIFLTYAIKPAGRCYSGQLNCWSANEEFEDSIN